MMAKGNVSRTGRGARSGRGAALTTVLTLPLLLGACGSTRPGPQAGTSAYQATLAAAERQVLQGTIERYEGELDRARRRIDRLEQQMQERDQLLVQGWRQAPRQTPSDWPTTMGPSATDPGPAGKQGCRRVTLPTRGDATGWGRAEATYCWDPQRQEWLLLASAGAESEPGVEPSGGLW